MPHKMGQQLRDKSTLYSTEQDHSSKRLKLMENSTYCSVSSACDPGVILSWCVVIYLFGVCTFPQPVKTVSASVIDFLPFPETLHKPPENVRALAASSWVLQYIMSVMERRWENPRKRRSGAPHCAEVYEGSCWRTYWDHFMTPSMTAECICMYEIWWI